MLNAIINWFGVLVGLNDLSFEWLLGKIFIPVALCIGVDPAEANDVAKVLGLKIVVNEFVAYKELQSMEQLSIRSRRLAEYALCGFANFSSMGIQLGGLGAIAPSRRPDLANVVWRALFTGATASLVNACVAGTLMSFDDEDGGETATMLTTTSMAIL
jgi:nucleoside permease NupC